MKKTGTARDIDRRRNKVSRLQDGSRWKKNRQLPPANKYWPTCLIIAPSSVVPNWEREFETVSSMRSSRPSIIWSSIVGLLRSRCLYGQHSWTSTCVARFQIWEARCRSVIYCDSKIIWVENSNVVITSFDLARGDIELLDNLAWSVVIIDEVHRLKNKKSKLAAAFSRFTCMRRFGLTGTAIQNSYDEMWAIADWTTPGLLGGHRQWRNTVSKPLRAGQSSKATEEERTITIVSFRHSILFSKAYVSKNIAKVLNEKVLPHFFLRRSVCRSRKMIMDWSLFLYRTKDIIANQVIAIVIRALKH